MFSSSVNSIDESLDSSSVIRVCYFATRGNRGPTQKDQHDKTGRKDRSVTFARPLVTNLRETQGLSSDSFSSPILAGHPNIYPNLNGPAVCRICYSSENSGPKTGEPLISPCNCKGTMGLYHRTCLNKWLAASNKTNCEICQFKFQIKRKKRTFWEYLRDQDSRSARRSLLTDILCFFLLTPLVLLSTVVCSFSAFQLMHEDDTEGNGLRFEIAIGLLFLSAVLLAAYSIWLGVTIVFHRKSLHNWQATHWNYTVVDQLSLEESMLVNSFDERPRSRMP